MAITIAKVLSKFFVSVILIVVTFLVSWTTSITNVDYEIKIPALGRIAKLGSLYDLRTDTFLSGSLHGIFPTLSIRENFSASSKNFYYRTVKSTADKFRLAKITDPLIALSVLSGQIITSGSTQFLNDESKAHSAHNNFETNNNTTGTSTVTGTGRSHVQFPYEIAVIEVLTVSERIDFTAWIGWFLKTTENAEEIRERQVVKEVIEQVISLGNESNTLYFVEEILYGGKAIAVLNQTSLDDLFTDVQHHQLEESDQESTKDNVTNQNERQLMEYTQHFQHFEHSLNGKGVPIQYVLSPFCVLSRNFKNTQNFQQFPDTVIKNATCDLPSPASSTKVSKNVTTKFFTTFDNISSVRQKLDELTTGAQALNTNASHLHHIKLELLKDIAELRQLKNNFESSVQDFKAQLREALKSFRFGGNEANLIEVLHRYEQGKFAPSQVLEASEIEFKYLQTALHFSRLEGKVKSLRGKLRDVKDRNKELIEQLQTFSPESVISQPAGLIKFGESFTNISECISTGGSKYAFSNNSLRLDLTSDVPQMKKEEIRKYNCIYNVFVSNSNVEQIQSSKSNIIKYIVEELAGITEPPNAALFKNVDTIQTQVEAELYNGKSGACFNLEILEGQVSYLNVLNSCVRLHAEKDCRGENRMYAANNGRWKNLSFGSKLRSIGPCYYDK